MTTREDVEVRLVRALSVDPSEDGLRWLDQRVARRMAQGTPEAAGSRRGRGARSLRIILRPLAVVVALVLLTSAVVGAMSLVQRLSAQLPGWTVAYDRAEIIGLAQTDAGYTITLERAYGDVNQVVAFFTIEHAGGLAAPRSGDGFLINQFSLNDTDVRDPSGGRAIVRTAATDLEPDRAAAAEAFQFERALVEGTYQLSIREIGFGDSGPTCVSPCMDDETTGNWQFAFHLPVVAGATVAVDAADTVGQATLHLTELRVSPTMIRARIGLDVDGRLVNAWAGPHSGVPATIRHGGAEYRVDTEMAQYVGDPQEGSGGTLFFTTAGSDGVSGTWAVQIPELSYQLTDGEMTTLTGPWTLAVSVP